MPCTWTPEQIQNQFLIITQARSGTQMLQYTMAAHPDIVIAHWNGLQPRKLLSLYDYRDLDDLEEMRGYRGTCTHQWGDEYTRKNFNLSHHRFWQILGYFFPRVIILNRNNQLRRYLSHQIAHTVGFSVIKKRNMEPTVFLDIEEFTAVEKSTIHYQQTVEAAFPEAMKITYEELKSDWGKVFENIQNYIGVQTIKIQPRTTLQEVRPLSEIIENWSYAMQQELIDRGYGEYLDGI